MTTVEPEIVHSLDQSPAPPRASVVHGLRNFARRSPMSAFWGCVAAAIILVAVAAPAIAPYPPLKSDFLRLTKPPAAPHYLGTDQIGRDT